MRQSPFIKPMQHFADAAFVVVEAAASRTDVKECRGKMRPEQETKLLIIQVLRILDNPKDLLIARNTSAVFRRAGSTRPPSS